MSGAKRKEHPQDQLPIKSPRTILVASHDPHLADVRKRVLEDAGYQVIAASSILEVRKGCRTNKIHLVVIGYSLPPSEKRRVCIEARECCKARILELFKTEPPNLTPETYIFQHHVEAPDDFLQAVKAILGSW
jgi:CheY-like chemotaxis protein